MLGHHWCLIAAHSIMLDKIPVKASISVNKWLFQTYLLMLVRMFFPEPIAALRDVCDPNLMAESFQ